MIPALFGSAVGTARSSIRPTTPLAHLVLAAQTIVGVGWVVVVVVFAAVMTHPQPQLAAIVSNRAREGNRSVPRSPGVLALRHTPQRTRS